MSNIEIRYLVFGSEELYYAHGGCHDFLGTAKNEQEALDIVETYNKKGESDTELDYLPLEWFHIFDIKQLKIVAGTKLQPPGSPNLTTTKIIDFKDMKKNPKTTRPSWNDYFMDMAHLIASRSTCLRRKVGAIIVKDNRILTTGYNGSPTKVPHCDKEGCLREKLNVPSGEKHELCRGVHAEQNAIIQAAYYGVSIQGSFLYCTNQSCSICAKMIVNAGITKVYFNSEYKDPLAIEIFNQANIEIQIL